MLDSGAMVGVAGDTLNTAIYMHRSAPELHVDYVTCLGDDPFSKRISDFIASHGIGTSAIRIIPSTSPKYYLTNKRIINNPRSKKIEAISKSSMINFKHPVFNLLSKSLEGQKKNIIILIFTIALFNFIELSNIQ